MAGSSFIQVPYNVTDAVTLKRFLDKLVLQLDIAFGNRGTSKFATDKELISANSTLAELISYINATSPTYLLLDGTREATGHLSYSVGVDTITFTDRNLVPKIFTDNTYEPKIGTKGTAFNKNFGTTTGTVTEGGTTEPLIGTKGTAFNKNFGTTTGTVTEGGTTTNNPIQTAIASLGLTISNPPTQAQVQAISNKVDEILVALRNSKIIL